MQRTVVAALLRREGKILICRRPEGKARALLWEFAGGKVEPNETPEEALVRECREELGVTVKVGEVYARLTHTYPDITVRLILFSCTLEEGEPQRLEHAALKWVSPAELLQYEFCPADAAIVEKLSREGGEG